MNTDNCAASRWADALACLRDNPDVHILQRVQPLKDWPKLPAPDEPLIHVLAIDTETTGFDPEYEKVIDFAAALLLVDQSGRIVEIRDAYEGLQDPGFELPEDITRITGLRDDDIAGQQLDLGVISAMLARAQLVVSHHAGFDRPFCEQLLPAFREKHWACSIRDSDLPNWGFDGAALGYLLSQCGAFNPFRHRALDDVASLLHLLAHVVPDGRTVLAHVLERAREPSWRIEATGCPYHLKHHLKRRNWRWNARERVWSIELRGTAAEAEERWYREEFLPHGVPPTVTRLTARERYR